MGQLLTRSPIGPASLGRVCRLMGKRPGSAARASPPPAPMLCISATLCAGERYGPPSIPGVEIPHRHGPMERDQAQRPTRRARRRARSIVNTNEILEADSGAPHKQRRTARRILDCPSVVTRAAPRSVAAGCVFAHE